MNPYTILLQIAMGAASAAGGMVATRVLRYLIGAFGKGNTTPADATDVLVRFFSAQDGTAPKLPAK